MSEFLIIQRFLPTYRKEVASKLTKKGIVYVIGTNIAGEKAKNALDLSSINYNQLELGVFSVFQRKIYYHKGLIKFLIVNKPKVILTEAESAMGTYLLVMLYRLVINRNVRAGVWCFFKLPGREYSKILLYVKKFLWSRFDFFVSYHSFGRDYLVSLGFSEERISIATNVCETDKFIAMRQLYDTLDKRICRRKWGISKDFVVGYIGTLSEAKRPDLLVNAAPYLNKNDISVLIAGRGDSIQNLRSLDSWSAVNYVEWTDNLLELYKAVDLLVLPGRGGIVISEALSLGVPVIVYQGDGVELDLIGEECGKVIKDNSVESLVKEIITFANHVNKTDVLCSCRQVIDFKFNSTTMSESIFNRFLIEESYASV